VHERDRVKGVVDVGATDIVLSPSMMMVAGDGAKLNDEKSNDGIIIDGALDDIIDDVDLLEQQQ
jgi:hypothetical protein